MENFTPYPALYGGILIGLSAALLMLLHGRIAGISAMFSGSIAFGKTDNTWRRFFLAGLLLGPLAIKWGGVQLAEIQIDASIPVVVLAGLLVGYGTSLGSGCTSGHGVCGLARLSLRSLVATLTFMSVAATTVYVIRHL